jgi:O-antigen/teichoic acid export membrane protein
MRDDIKKDYLWNTIGVLAQNAISPLLLVVITRVNGINTSGIFSFAFSLSLIFWALGMWGGRTYQVSDVTREFTHRSYIMVRLVLATVMLIGAIIFVVANHYDMLKSSVTLALVLFKILESIADSIYGVLQVHNRLFIVGKSLLYKATAGFFSFVLLDALTKDIFLGCVAIVAVNLLFILFYDLRHTRKLEDIVMRRQYVKHYVENAIVIIRRCAPVAAMIFLSMFSLNIPRYFIDKYHGNEIGYFGIIAMPITLIALIMSFILQPNMVGLAKLYEERNYSAFNKIIMRLLAITTSIGVVILLGTFAVGVPALHIVFAVNFTSYKAALMIMVAGGIINAIVSVFINILIIMRYFKAQFYTLLITNIALGVLSAIVIKTHGLTSGVTLFAAANLIQALFLAGSYGTILHKAQHVEV